MVESFLNICRYKRYGPGLTKKIIINLKYIATAYPQMFATAEINDIFYFLNHFLTMDMLDIQYATVQTLSYLFDTNWIVGHGQFSPTINLIEFHRQLFAKCNLPEPMEEDGDNVITDIDKKSRSISVHIQLYMAVISRNYILRKKNWFLLAKLCFQKQLSKGKFYKNKIKNLASKTLKLIIIINFQITLLRLF